VLASAAVAVFAAGGDTRSSEQKAIDAQAAGRYEAAIKYYQEFIGSSVGDPGLPKAQKAVLDCVVALAREWGMEGREADAARLYLWLAGDPATSTELREEYLKKATQVMTAGMLEAKTKRQFARALDLQKEWTGLFPKVASPYKPEELETFALEGLAAACQEKLNLMALPEVVKQFYPTGAAPWEQLARKNRNETLEAAKLRALGEMGWSGRVIAEGQLLPTDSPLRPLVEKALMARVDAWAAQGNVAATTDALALARATITTENKLNLLKMTEAKLAKKSVGDVQELAFPGPVRGRVSWQDAGAGYRAKEVVLEENADVSILAGFVLHGGTLEVRRGARLHVKGSATQPVVLEGVTVSLHSGGHFDAEHAVFVHCKFEKNGDVGNGRYATHWGFANCLLYRSEFESLSLAGYGVSMTNSAWIESVIPGREVPGSDVAGTYKDKSNRVENCLFFRCPMAVSTVWMTDQCNFVRCPVGQEETFESKGALAVSLFVPEGDPMVMGLKKGTMVTDRGDLKYMFVRKSFEVALPAAFWALLPGESYEMPRREVAATSTAPATGPASAPATRASTRPATRTATKPTSRPANGPASRPVQ
jgi:hypothetical protein